MRFSCYGVTKQSGKKTRGVCQSRVIKSPTWVNRKKTKRIIKCTSNMKDRIHYKIIAQKLATPLFQKFARELCLTYYAPIWPMWCSDGDPRFPPFLWLECLIPSDFPAVTLLSGNRTHLNHYPPHLDTLGAFNVWFVVIKVLSLELRLVSNSQLLAA